MFKIEEIMERKSFLVTELLCLFLGLLGAHRFYTGYIGLGILQLLTLADAEYGVLLILL